MPRLAALDPALTTGKVKDIFDGPLKGKHFNMFRSMANSPAALQTYLGMAGALGAGLLDGKEREAIQLAIGESNGCGYCVAAHTLIGKGAGLTDDQTMQARRGALADTKLDTLVKFTLAINEKRGHVSDADVQAMRKAGYADGHIAEAVAVWALATYTNVFNHVNETVSDFPAVAAV